MRPQSTAGGGSAAAAAQLLGRLQPADPSGEFLRLVLEPERAGRASPASQPIDIADSAAAGAQIANRTRRRLRAEELEAFDLSAFGRLGMGPRVLRTETAAIAAIAVLQARYGDMSVVSHDSSRTADS